MNVLPLVFSFLALITILTYTRLSGFVISKAVHEEYQQFIKNYQEDVFEQAAVEKYRKSSRQIKSEESDPAPQSKTPAHRYLNIFPLLQKEDEKSKETAWIFSNLIKLLFANAPFFQQAVSENPRIVEDLIASMRGAFSDLKDPKKFKKGDLCTLELNQPQLQLFFYRILKDPGAIEEEDEDEKWLFNEGARRLNEVISFHKTVRPIRIFLADPILLKAIFESETVVDNIVAARKNYYNLMKKNPDRKEALSDEFRSQFISALPTAIHPASVNWDVSGTAPDQFSMTKKESK